jgi:MFS family permease
MVVMLIHPFAILTDVALSTLYLYVGLFCGALFWGISADILGRKFSWNLTLLLSGALGVAAGGVQSFNAWCAVIALLGFAVGGNCKCSL